MCTCSIEYANTHPTLFTSLHYHIHNTEVDNLHIAFKDLTDRQEKVASDVKVKTKLDDNERVVSSKEEDISSTRAELDLLEQQIVQYKASTAKKVTNQLAEIESASQHCQDLVDKAESELKAARVMHAELTREDGDVVSACVYIYVSYNIIPHPQSYVSFTPIFR